MTDSDSQARDFFIVGIGASAGGVQALEAFFNHLPDDPSAAFVVVQHLSPDHKSMMSQILQRQTVMSVRELEDDLLIEPGQVYVLPPRKTLVVDEQHFHLQDQSDSLSYPINRFFKSLAQNWGERTIAILLSGTGNDGTEGLEEISRAGGIALVQSPETAQFTSMPSSAIPSGTVDEILSPQDLAQTVFELIRFSSNFSALPAQESGLISPDQLQQVLEVLADREDIDFSHYKISTLSRRISHRCALTNKTNLDAYIALLEESEEEQKLLRQDLLIGATCFFRDRPAWEFLESEVLPQLIANLQPQEQLRVWVSACATGEEAYSMAILIDEAIAAAGKPVQVKIFATDLDTSALEVVARGTYPESIANDVSAERLERYFSYDGGHFHVNRLLREMLIIAPHNLTKNAGFSKMNLVSCRNVLIYMQPQLQQQVLRLLHFALAPQGVLFLGSSETLGDVGEEFSALNPKWKIFRKRRDAHLSLMPITRQAVITPIRPGSRSKARQNQIDRLFGEVFRYCLVDRPITCLLVNQENQLLRVFYNAANLLEFPVGEAILDVTEIVHPALRLPLSTALHRTKRDQEPVLYTGIKIEKEGEELSVSVRVGPDQSNPKVEDYLIAVLEVETRPAPAEASLRFDVDKEAAQQITELEYELQQTRENLQVTIEELETTNEEQQATNEELLASNEELQSTNEELQSVNEELYTVNAEYQNKIQELTQLNNDIDNLLRSTDIGVVFLDADLNIRKFTPAATRAINIKPKDQGRPLADLTNNIDLPDFLSALQQVVETGQPSEHEVQVTQTGEYLLMRVNPYLKDKGQSDGVVVTFVNIDELKRYQEELHQASETLENLYTASPVGLCLLDQELRFVKVNRAMANTNGLPIEAHLGKTTQEVLPDLADHLEPILRQVIQTGEAVYDIKIEGTTPLDPNTERTWTASYYPVDLLNGRRGVGAVVVEITDQLQAEEALLYSQSQLLEAQRLTNVGNWEITVGPTFDLESARADWSEELFRIYGFDPKQPMPTLAQLLQHHPEEDRQRLRQALEQLMANCTAYSLDVAYRQPDGQLRYLSVIGRALCDENDQVIRLYGTVVDITERKQIEKTLIQQNHVLEEAIAIAQAADSANEAKSEFLANMSHEIRTPMNAILGYSQLLGRTQLSQQQQNFLEKIAANNQKLLSLIDDILDLSKLEARQIELDVQPFFLDVVMQNLAASFEHQAAAKGLSFSLERSPDLPDTLIGDDFRLQQVLNNLVSNAIKFTQIGQIRVSADYAVSALASQLSSPDTIYLRFEVQDTGIGIKSEDRERLFQPFIQADTSTTRQYGGTGLGLTICRRLVELMDGEIGVESTLGEGTTFWFAVPFQVPAGTSSSTLKLEKTATAANSPLQQRRILVVEDYPDNREFLLIMLEELGCQTDWVDNGQDALDRLAVQTYDIVLMDCQLPEIDGYETTRRLRQREADSQHTIVIGLTAHAMVGDREKCLQAGMDDYMRKPVDMEQLFTLLEKWSG
ncbi:chemotaxis protein CheB [Sphaerothrix gracilis]|uniref:chemotaxis protein CheB n=1 Tax=Sphaerothrix gracilis TaxID=3151835 RepID=UPI0031FD2ADE